MERKNRRESKKTIEWKEKRPCGRKEKKKVQWGMTRSLRLDPKKKKKKGGGNKYANKQRSKQANVKQLFDMTERDDDDDDNDDD